MVTGYGAYLYLKIGVTRIKKEDLPSRGLPLHLGGLTTGAILDQEEGSPEQRPAIALGWADSRHFHKAWLSGVHNFW
ncbi:hypothetical protein TNIN_120781 [Trichonephila inaurata madagascariensis]|uniref:Uncharacterized protein n=1 Tax=Trichonephila inaurata madagascariensis TaxID=2747483 RepID=A0A8X6M6R1_9ARAC|nr:hypothetical protein TNIN_120781 [Trichonephila inaurata madagascariensis]